MTVSMEESKSVDIAFSLDVWDLMAELSDFNDDWTTKLTRRNVPVSTEAFTIVSSLMEPQVKMIDRGRIPCFRGCECGSFETSSRSLLEGRLTCIRSMSIVAQFQSPAGMIGRAWSWKRWF